MPAATTVSHYRRRVLALAAIPTLLLYIVGAVMFNNRIEADLESRVADELSAVGVDTDDVSVIFDGQDGAMSCAAALADPPAVEDAAYEVWGVYRFELDRSCRTNTGVDTGGSSTTASSPETTPSPTAGPSTTAPATTMPPPGFDTVADLLRADPQYSTFNRLADEIELGDQFANPAAGPLTVFAPTNDAFDAIGSAQMAVLEADPDLIEDVLTHHVADGRIGDLDAAESVATIDGGDLAITPPDGVSGATVDLPSVVVGNGVVYAIDAVLLPDEVDLAAAAEPAPASASFDGAVVTLTGVAADDTVRTILSDAAPGANDIEVTDELTVDAVTGLGPDVAEPMAALITAMVSSLTRGSVDFDGSDLTVSGEYATDADLAAMTAAATDAGATATLQPRPEATADDAATIEAELNALVADEPILFEQASAEIADESTALLDRLAAGIQQYSGVTVDVRGHTDSDGDAADNQALSEARAAAVRQALIDNGVAAGQLTATGLGETEPIIVDGVEDKTASRRVVFSVDAG